MINKTEALLFLRQPFVYNDRYFSSHEYKGMSLTGVKKSHSFQPIMLNGCNKSMKTSNYKVNYYNTISTSSVGFYNMIGSTLGSVVNTNTHIGRVFNRTLLPTNKDCFFNTGNMGSSNGTVVPSVNGSYKTRISSDDFAKGDVWVLQILNTGATGVSKFRYSVYPFLETPWKYRYNRDSDNLQPPKYPFILNRYGWSESMPLESISNNSEIRVKGRYHSYILSGYQAETRFRKDNDEPFNFVLNTDKQNISVYTDPSFTILDRQFAINDGLGNITIEMVTFANGSIYGITPNGAVYSINITDGSATEISDATQSGTSVFIMASYDQTRVYTVVNRQVKIIHTSDNTVTTPTNNLPETPTLEQWGAQMNIDYYNDFWLKGKKYDKDTFEVLFTLTNGAAHMAVHNINCIIPFAEKSMNDYTTEYLYTIALDGTHVEGVNVKYNSSNNNRHLSIYDKTVFHSQTNFADSIYRQGLPSVMHPDDILRSRYRGSKKDWRIYDGSSWVKGWYKDETPSGDVDSSNLTFTCLNVPTDLLAGTLSITVDGGSPITDNGDGTLSDGGTVTYSTGTFTLATAPTTSITVNYELTSNAVTGTDVALQDGVVVDFEDGVEAPHFVEGDYFSFTVAEGHIVDNLEAYSASVDLYVVPYHDISDETFTISATAMDVAATVNTGFIKVESDIGLTGTIAGSEATIITSGDPAAGEIKVDYNSGALTFHADDVGSTAVISYRWLERPE